MKIFGLVAACLILSAPGANGSGEQPGGFEGYWNHATCTLQPEGGSPVPCEGDLYLTIKKESDGDDIGFDVIINSYNYNMSVFHPKGTNTLNCSGQDCGQIGETALSFIRTFGFNHEEFSAKLVSAYELSYIFKTDGLPNSNGKSQTVIGTVKRR